jgi:hypothetical protein
MAVAAACRASRGVPDASPGQLGWLSVEIDDRNVLTEAGNVEPGPRHTPPADPRIADE